MTDMSLAPVGVSHCSTHSRLSVVERACPLRKREVNATGSGGLRSKSFFAVASVAVFCQRRLRRIGCVACGTITGRGRRKTLESFVLVALPIPCYAEGGAKQDAPNIIRSEGDVYYPPWFAGTWEATTELFSLEFPQGDAAAGQAVRQRDFIGTRKAVEQYPQRYIEYKNKLIADRGFNMRGLVRGSGGGPRALEEVEWEPSNPDYSAVTIKRDGVSVKTETRIARRSIAIAKGQEDLFTSSEVYQQIVTAPGSQFPQEKVTPVRCVNKFKRENDSKIEVLQRVEVFPRVDPLVPPSGGVDPKMPVAIFNYRGVLKKRSDAIEVVTEPKSEAL